MVQSVQRGNGPIRNRHFQTVGFYGYSIEENQRRRHRKGDIQYERTVEVGSQRAYKLT